MSPLGVTTFSAGCVHRLMAEILVLRASEDIPVLVTCVTFESAIPHSLPFSDYIHFRAQAKPLWPAGLGGHSVV